MAWRLVEFVGDGGGQFGDSREPRRLRQPLLRIAQGLRQFRAVIDVDIEAEELHHLRAGCFSTALLSIVVDFEPRK